MDLLLGMLRLLPFMCYRFYQTSYRGILKDPLSLIRNESFGSRWDMRGHR